VRRLISRTAACIVSATVALSAAAVPCTAGETASRKSGAQLTRLSPASRALLVSAPASPKLRSSEQPAATPSSPGSFFGTTRGKVTLALMGVGAGFALWSIHHDRIPVKSPVR
jgi:hypothetical protein